VTTSSITIYRPEFAIDLSTVSLTRDDYDMVEAHEVVGQERDGRSTVAVFEQAGHPPAVAFATTIGHARALGASFRIAGYTCKHVDPTTDVDTCRALVSDLIAGRLAVITNTGRLSGWQPIPQLRSIVLVAPTARLDVHQRRLGRIDRTTGAVSIVDMTGDCARHGTWEGEAPPKVVTGGSVDVVADPMLARLTTASHRDLMKWAGHNIGRIEILQRALNRKLGWAYHVIKATCGQAAAERWWASRPRNGEIPTRGGLQRPSRRRPRVASPDRLQLHP
jgi:hypothetical protein